jgi:hypothetical protein
MVQGGVRVGAVAATALANSNHIKTSACIDDEVDVQINSGHS